LLRKKKKKENAPLASSVRRVAEVLAADVVSEGIQADAVRGDMLVALPCQQCLCVCDPGQRYVQRQRRLLHRQHLEQRHQRQFDEDYNSLVNSHIAGGDITSGRSIFAFVNVT
jgi:hypothetical protein